MILFSHPEPEKLGSAQCPRCGRFCKVIRRTDGMNPDYWCVVQCPTHGEGQA